MDITHLFPSRLPQKDIGFLPSGGYTQDTILETERSSSNLLDSYSIAILKKVKVETS